MLNLRPYQADSKTALYSHWQSGGGNGLIVIPTGGGKSLVIASLLQELMAQFPLMRIGMVTHSKELIVQNFQELLKVWPQAPAGIYSAGVGRRDTRHPIIFCGIQSVWNKVEQFGKFDLLLIDEAHLIGRNIESTYGKFLASLKLLQPDMRIVGLTATPFRLDSGRLDEGEDRMFEKIIYEANVADLISDGFLSPLISKATAAEISVQGVHKRGGEYIAGELERAAMVDGLVDRAVQEIIKQGGNRRAWLAFCSGVEHAGAVRDAMRNYGIAAECVDGSMGKRERDGAINAFKQGRLRCLTSVNVLSIGFNVPHVDLIALLRPTQSAGLYIQQVGRAFRKAPNKTNALILDFAGNVRRHGPVDMVEVEDKPSSAKGEGGAVERVMAKECPSCQTLNPMAVRHCLICDFEFQVKAKHEAKADTEVAIMSGKDRDGFVPVKGVHYYRHEKRDNPEAFPTLRVEYGVGIDSLRAWYCFSHAIGSMPYRKAAAWWLEAGGQVPVPQSVDDALQRTSELHTPSSILWRKVDGGFKEVVARRYAPQQTQLQLGEVAA